MRSGPCLTRSGRGKFSYLAGFQVSTSPRSRIIFGNFRTSCANSTISSSTPSVIATSILSRANGITNFSIIPNGASEVEFGRGTRHDGRLRNELGIPATDLVFLTVGAPTSAKGHEIVAEAFGQVDTGGRSATLILNGDWPATRFGADRVRAVFQRFASLNSMQKGIRLFREAGVKGVIDRLFPKPPDQRSRVKGERPALAETNGASTNASGPQKTVLRVDLPR